MNLVIDKGNTNTKIALFQKDKLMQYVSFRNEEFDSIQEFITTNSFDNSLFASTSVEDARLIEVLQQKSNVFELSSELKLPIHIAYETKTTLGDDRIAVACGAVQLLNSDSILAITLGTCITYNFIHAKSFIGGAISPGLYMRYKAMHTFTGKLPLAPNDEFDQLIGKTTIESLQSGVRRGVIAEVDGIIDEYSLLYANLSVIISGGDTAFFESRLKNNIFAEQNLVLIGMNEILRYNIDE